MPNIKGKSLKPSRNVPYAEGILMYNGTGAEIAVGALVRVASGALQGGGLKMTHALAAPNTIAGHRLGMKVPIFVTKHRVPAGGWGVVLPWTIVSNLNTAGLTEGNVIYLANAGGTFQGTAGTNSRAVGIVIAAHATLGIVWLCPSKFNHATI